MKILLPLVLLLAACGTQKFTPELSEQNGGAGGGACPKNYDPIPLIRPEGGTLVMLESLRDGRYSLRDIDYFIHKEDLHDFRIHFEEKINNMGLIRKQICATSVDKKLAFQVAVEGVTNYLNPPDATKTKGHTVRSFSVRADEGRLLTNVIIDQSVRAGDFAPVLAQYQETRIYQLNPDTYEIRAQNREIIDGSVVTKRVRQTLIRDPY